jgi:hypothetical protein
MLPSGGTNLVPRSEPTWSSGKAGYNKVAVSAQRSVPSSLKEQRLPRSEVLKRSSLAQESQSRGTRGDVRGNPDRFFDGRSEADAEREATEAILSGCGPEFEVSVDRSQGQSLGIEVEHYTDSLLVVMSVQEGLIQEFNRENQDSALEVDDLIAGANGVTGDVDNILTECRKTESLRLAVRRPRVKTKRPNLVEVEYMITLDKTQGSRLGIDVNHEHGRELFIESIEDGLVRRWNEENPEQKVQPEDRIVEVNGISGEVQKLLQECMKDTVLEVKLIRSEFKPEEA